MIAHGKFVDAFTERFDHAGAVGHGNAAVLGLDRPVGDEVVVKIQGAGVDANAHLAGSRFPGGFTIEYFEIVEAARAAH